MDFYSRLNSNQRFLFWVAVFILGCWIYNRYFNPNFGQSGQNNNGDYSNQWINTPFGYGYGQMTPANKLPVVIKEFGNPSVYDGSSGGSAIWNEEALKGTPYVRVELHDEQIPHDKPAKHVDFLYSWYQVEVPEHKVGNLKQISESIAYDPAKKLMSARCHDMRANVVTHWVVRKYADDELTLDEAVGMYGPMIMELFQSDPGDVKYRQLESEL